VLKLLVPLRHVAWGANMNNAFICAYGYGTALSQPCMYHSMDQLGIAQYLTRVGLLLGDDRRARRGQEGWMEDDTWQGLRRYVEDSMVLKDPFELFVAQNVALDGLLYPLVYETIIDDVLASQGGTPVAMLTQFMTDWFAETRKWVDATVKTAAAESPRTRHARQVDHPLARPRRLGAGAGGPIALGARPTSSPAKWSSQFNARMAKAGVTL
jgi:phenol hydroxylase P1 protein